MGLSEAPHISDIRPNAPVFREALADAAGIIGLEAATYSMYSRHRHHNTDGMMVFENRVSEDELELYPLSIEEARAQGLPSCWGIDDENGLLVPVRYASWELHEDSGIDVTSAAFQKKSVKIGQALAEKGLGKTLELNIAGLIFPRQEGTVTLEVTNETEHYQRLTRIPVPAEIIANDWTMAACWNFDQHGNVFVTGICSDETMTWAHKPPQPPQPEEPKKPEQ